MLARFGRAEADFRSSFAQLQQYASAQKRRAKHSDFQAPNIGDILALSVVNASASDLWDAYVTAANAFRTVSSSGAPVAGDVMRVLESLIGVPTTTIIQEYIIADMDVLAADGVLRPRFDDDGRISVPLTIPVDELGSLEAWTPSVGGTLVGSYGEPLGRRHRRGRSFEGHLRIPENVDRAKVREKLGVIDARLPFAIAAWLRE